MKTLKVLFLSTVWNNKKTDLYNKIYLITITCRKNCNAHQTVHNQEKNTRKLQTFLFSFRLRVRRTNKYDFTFLELSCQMRTGNYSWRKIDSWTIEEKCSDLYHSKKKPCVKKNVLLLVRSSRKQVKNMNILTVLLRFLIDYVFF